jgi:hypothetical protein
MLLLLLVAQVQQEGLVEGSPELLDQLKQGGVTAEAVQQAP